MAMTVTLDAGLSATDHFPKDGLYASRFDPD